VTEPVQAPLSFGQQRLWFLQQLLPATTAYNLSHAFRFHGPLDPDVLADSLRRLVERHEVLRTSFPLVAGAPVQRIAPPGPLPLPLTDLSDVPAGDRDARVRAIAAADLGRPFDLTAEVPMRVRLVRLSPTEHVLVMIIHHILIDGWSVGRLLDELAEFYTAGLAGRLPTLPPLPMQFRDVARWQRSDLVGDRLSRSMDWWRAHLADPPGLLDLPTDRPRPLVQTFAGRIHELTIPRSRWDEVVDTGRQHRTTPFVVFLAAYAVLLGRLSDQQDLVIGTPVAGRATPEQELLIGPFASTLPLRVDLGEDPSFADLLARLRRVTLGGLSHQDLPYEKLVDDVCPDRVMSHNPLVQAMLTFMNLPPMRSGFAPGVTVAPVTVDPGTSFVDLLLLVLPPEQDEFQLRFVYKSDLFDPATVARTARSFELLLGEAVVAPRTRVSRLPLMDAAARTRVLAGWSTGGDAYPQRPLVPELFATQARRTPAAAAIRFRGAMLTYAELSDRADRLARHLRDRGAGPDRVVALHMPRSPELVVAVLGVLRAGAAFLPLDPADPPGRVRELATAARAIHVLTLDTFAELGADAAGERPADPDPDNLAYVMYTSGSTGAPKAVACTHRGLTNVLLWLRDTFPLAPDDRVLQKTVATFDVSVAELLWPLLSGACLVVAEPEGHRDPRYLTETIQAERITTIHFVPPMLATFLNEAGPGQCDSLRRVICIGQALTEDLHRAFHERLCAVLHNLYGPTEAAIEATAWRCRREDTGRTVPIGRPMPGVECHVLDRHMQPVPPGIAGELYLGGVGLARGYLGRPDLTADRFVPHPWRPGARLYRTGDRVRWRPDANLEFLGRTDDQLKIRGYRIEPGEVEAALREHPMVRDAVVRARTDRAGNTDLVGYVVPGRSDAFVRQASERAGAQAAGEWGRVFDEAYRADRQPDATELFAGWHSSYSGKPIPPAQMREWLDAAVDLIASRRPRRVLDIGCGTGLFLFRLAPHCERYVGTEISTVALADLEPRVRRAGLDPARVGLRRQTADDLTGLAGERFDAVILNSVVQYFPSAGHLVRVLEQLAGLVEPGGFVFVGDVRHVGLWRAFVTSVARHRGRGTDSTADLRERVDRAMAAENELLIDPDLFRMLARHGDRFGAADVRVKRGRGDNELTRFRYDVLLDVVDPGAGGPAGAAAAPVRDWQRDRLTVAASVEWLARTRPARAVLARIPDARVAADLRAAAALAEPGGPGTVGELAALLAAPTGDPPIEPEELATALEELGYRVQVRCSADGGPGRFDIALGDVAPPPAPPTDDAAEADWDRFTNPCLRARLEREMLPVLRDHLAGRLPGYMVPARYAVLDRLPLARNGKLDYRRLPAPTLVGTADPEDYLAPRTVTEQLLADVVAGVLGLDRVGVTDDFFALGGDSLRSIQVCARAREAGIQVSPQAVFLHPTVAELANLALPVPVDPADESGTVSLTPTQRAILASHGGEDDGLVDRMPLAATGPLDLALLERALSVVARRHDVLRYRRTGDVLAPSAEEPRIERPELASGRRPLRVFAAGAAGTEGLTLVVDRLLLDRYSIAVLLDELTVAYRQLAAGAAVRLPERTTGFAVWARGHADHPAAPVRSGPAQEATGAPEEATRASVSLDEQDLAALTGPLCAAYRMSRDELLVAGAVMALAAAGYDTVCLRRRCRDPELARSVGRFDTMASLSLSALSPADDPAVALPDLKEALRAAGEPGRSVPRAVVHYREPAVPPDPAQPPLLRFATAAEAADRLAAEVDVVVDDGPGLRVEAIGTAAVRVLAAIEESLDRLRRHSRVPDIGACTPSDFPLAGLDRTTLRALFGPGRQVEDAYPVSPQQEWMLWQYHNRPRPGLYVTYGAQSADDIDADAWRDAWYWAVRRHATLRTALVSEGAPRPLQVVHRDAPLSWHAEDLRRLSPAGQRERLDAYLAEAGLAGFELTRPGQLRHAMFRVGTRAYWWAFVGNYQLVDGMAFPRLLDDVHAAYRAFRAGRVPQVPDPVRVSDYLGWVARQNTPEHVSYWRRALAGFRRPTPLLDRLGATRAAPVTGLPYRQARTLSLVNTTAMRSQGRRHGVTFYTLLQAGWALLLHSYTGEADVVFGNVISGRPDTMPDAGRIVGYCNLQLPARVRIRADRPLVDWLRGIQAEQVEARAHQVCPLLEIRRVSEVPAGLELYQSNLTFLDFPVDSARDDTWQRITGDTITEHQINLTVVPGRSLVLSIAYHLGGLDDRVRRMLEHLDTVYTAFGRSLDGTVGDLAALLTDESTT
jgi:amino acid adenylation domain-containing protein